MTLPNEGRGQYPVQVRLVRSACELRCPNPFVRFAGAGGRERRLRFTAAPQSREAAQGVEPEWSSERDRADRQEPAEQVPHPVAEALEPDVRRVAGFGRPAEGDAE